MGGWEDAKETATAGAELRRARERRREREILPLGPAVEGRTLEGSCFGGGLREAEAVVEGGGSGQEERRVEEDSL